MLIKQQKAFVKDCYINNNYVHIEKKLFIHLNSMHINVYHFIIDFDLENFTTKPLIDMEPNKGMNSLLKVSIYFSTLVWNCFCLQNEILLGVFDPQNCHKILRLYCSGKKGGILTERLFVSFFYLLILTYS